ncbi:MAG TPA: fused MFS/spermidine synthase [Candidatus Polarisedimenticolaceae bacterium]|nr:fused MFS/spermidine synthase [Candidatus Polarisedimenticolaceae bacterium]
MEQARIQGIANHWSHGAGVRIAAALALSLMVSCGATTPNAPAAGTNKRLDEKWGAVQLERKSKYSTIRVRQLGSVRSLTFAGPDGNEAIQTQVDLVRPYALRLNYGPFMFASYLLRPHQERVLIVGLGGGAMVLFLREYDPSLRVDAVEIDPEVTRIASEYFGVRSDEKVNVVTADGVEFLKSTDQMYDVIYMDTYLTPSDSTDAIGVDSTMRTVTFYQNVQRRLTPGGIIVFNINWHDRISADLASIRSMFPQTYVFEMPFNGGYVVLGSMDSRRIDRTELIARARTAQGVFHPDFSFEQLLRTLR